MHIVAGRSSLLYFHRDFSSPEDFTLAIIAESPDEDGKVTLYWDRSRYADNYSLYYFDSVAHYEYMVSTLIENGLHRQNYSLINLVDGFYTFKILAHNRFGNCSSNLKLIEVKLPYIYPDSEVPWYLYLVVPAFLLLCFVCAKGKLDK